jgi:DNA-binding LytR/AlgR family response regulator
VETLAEWESRLGGPAESGAGPRFFRIHRSHLVNLDRVRAIRVRKGRLTDLRAAVGLE